jgi:feruloyl esterase
MNRYLLCACLAAVPLTALAQTPCEQLKSLKLVDTAITLTESAGPGAFQLPGASPAAVGPVLPAFCRVAATLKPSLDSDIKIEVWLPADGGWNRNYLAVGGGGWVGSINYGAMATAVQEGYATSSTDTGHIGGTADFAVGHPEKVIDFAYRAVHEMTVKAKAIIAAHYGRGGPRLSYWTGCSTGGRQGLLEAQRYPADFDGIIAGAPANNQIQLSAWRFALETAALKDPARVVPLAKAGLLNRAVLAACDTLDGVKDGFLSDPQRCHFDPSTLLCRGVGDGDCLTAPQLESIKQAYAPANKETGERIYPGLVHGSEAGWALLAAPRPEPNVIDLGMFRLVAHQDPAWDWRLFDLDRDLMLAEQKAGSITAVNPDLSAFKARGGKLLIYHGWNDGGSGGAISPLNTLDYFSSVAAKMGQKQDDWLRLFMVPGMAHCGGGPGPNQFNAMAALERWRDAGVAPDQITAYHVENNRVTMTRPLCPYPQVAAYKGTGSTNDAANFACKAP